MGTIQKFIPRRGTCEEFQHHKPIPNYVGEILWIKHEGHSELRIGLGTNKYFSDWSAPITLDDTQHQALLVRELEYAYNRGAAAEGGAR